MRPSAAGRREATMFRDALIIFRKEAGNVFRDRRVVFANYILPLLLMPVIFCVIGFIMKAQFDSRAGTVYRICLVNSPGAEFETALRAELKYRPDLERASTDGVTIEFPASYRAGQSGRVLILADGTRQNMVFAADRAKSAVDAYNRILTSQRLQAAGLCEADLNPLTVERVDVSEASAQGSGFVATMLPFLLLIMVFAGSMSIGMAITAGEKDKGTLACLLVNQVSRSSIAIGKSMFLVVSSLISASANVLGILAAIFLMSKYFSPSDGGGGDPMSDAMNFTGLLTQPANLLVFAVSLLCASGLAASIIVFLGTKARNMKEANGYIMPVYMLVLVAAMATMQMDTVRNIDFYLIPFVNTVFVIKGSILASLSVSAVLMSTAVNIACIALFVWLTTREFNSERVLYTG